MSGEAPARLLRELGRGAKKRHGQHFLSDPSLLRRIVALADLRPGARVLEIGPGLGALTEALVEAGAEVTAVEIDAELAERLAGRLPGVRVVQGDALTQDLDDLAPGEGWRVCANLPYNVGTPIFERLVESWPRFDRLVLMFQREVARRIVASPGDEAYGALSVLSRACADLRIALHVPPGAFHPPPKVWSSVIVADLLAEPRRGGLPREAFRRAVRAGFSQRRKRLENALASTYGRDPAREALAALGLSGLRAEALDHADWERLAARLELAQPGTC